MDKLDKAKLKVLIKMILINKTPNTVSASEITSIINEYEWGFRTSITPSKVSRLLSHEIKRKDKNFLNGVYSMKRNKRDTLSYGFKPMERI